jgi:hypothetical protein
MTRVISHRVSESLFFRINEFGGNHEVTTSDIIHMALAEFFNDRNQMNLADEFVISLSEKIRAIKIKLSEMQSLIRPYKGVDFDQINPPDVLLLFELIHKTQIIATAPLSSDKFDQVLNNFRD